MVLAIVLPVNLEPRLPEGPPGESRGELVVGTGNLLIDAGKVGLQKSLKRLSKIRSGYSTPRPDRVDEARAADFEPVEPARLERRHQPAGKTHATCLELRGVEFQAGDRRVVGCIEPAAKHLSVRAS